MTTIDALHLPRCGLIKLDLNGAETLALYGADQTLRQSRPVLVVEEKGLGPARAGTPKDGTATFLQRLNYVMVASLWPDVIYVTR
jgi:hypothetical protein